MSSSKNTNRLHQLFKTTYATFYMFHKLYRQIKSTQIILTFKIRISTSSFVLPFNWNNKYECIHNKKNHFFYSGMVIFLNFQLCISQKNNKRLLLFACTDKLAAVSGSPDVSTPRALATRVGVLRLGRPPALSTVCTAVLHSDLILSKCNAENSKNIGRRLS